MAAKPKNMNSQNSYTRHSSIYLHGAVVWVWTVFLSSRVYQNTTICIERENRKAGWEGERWENNTHSSHFKILVFAMGCIPTQVTGWEREKHQRQRQWCYKKVSLERKAHKQKVLWHHSKNHEHTACSTIHNTKQNRAEKNSTAIVWWNSPTNLEQYTVRIWHNSNNN